MSKKPNLSAGDILKLAAMICGASLIWAVLLFAYLAGQLIIAMLGLMFLGFIGMMVASMD